jgi:NAD(P)-dependent dehydrogenase (short-subunit alcohol dehydrogenase family)
MTMVSNSIFDLSDQIIIVTGGSGLIGRPICETIDAHGGTTIVADVDENGGSELAASLENGVYKHLDITDSDSIETLCDAVSSEYGRIDGLINLAYPRTESYGQQFESVGTDDLIENMSLHLGGYYAMIKAVGVRMVEQGEGGSIVNFSSIYGMQAPDFSVYNGTEMTSPVEYSVIKAGILNLTRYVASYLAADDIRVNSVSPGGVFDGQNPQFVEQYETEVPIGRMADPEEIAGGVVYLLSDAASYVTGHNLVIDGGWTIK